LKVAGAFAGRQAALRSWEAHARALKLIRAVAISAEPASAAKTTRTGE